ncbi:3-demethoxyubiquinol 3-hydroxylase [Halotalea alkalilenta]|uniref:Uncharacterized protein n=1 Tax=Halotalea alkalilenta TaxID=376489 RepID=A0A172YH20_9GAMM|nr:demethoxyubiquinone hydroxylase family protein [Halotalea alkalilenta]ANF58560.1 hypothetical protein A5892_14655 [Halotalea alkalilenta]
MPPSRQYSFTDRLIEQFDAALRTLAPSTVAPAQASPAVGVNDAGLTEEERHTAAQLLRIDHIDQLASVALYRGRALGAPSEEGRRRMLRHAEEGFDRLLWCRARLRELEAKPSLLAPLIYFVSLGGGAISARLDDRWGLGLVNAQAERIGNRVDRHLSALPAADQRSRAILERIAEREAQQAHIALEAGGTRAAAPLRLGFVALSKAVASVARRI